MLWAKKSPGWRGVADERKKARSERASKTVVSLLYFARGGAVAAGAWGADTGAATAPGTVITMGAA